MYGKSLGKYNYFTDADVVREVRNVLVKVDNVVAEVRNVSHEVGNVLTELNNVSISSQRFGESKQCFVRNS
ncbi:hypothetical protein V6B14_02545 [Sporosarcina psychrophila]